MAIRIIPRIIRGRVFYQIADVLFPTFAQVASIWSAATTLLFNVIEGARA